MTDADRLRAIGTALWGTIWQTEMSRALGHNGTRTVRFWASADRPVPPGAWGDLRRICDARQDDVERAMTLADEACA